MIGAAIGAAVGTVLLAAVGLALVTQTRKRRRLNRDGKSLADGSPAELHAAMVSLLVVLYGPPCSLR